MDLSKIVVSSSKVSTKLIKSGTASVSVPSTGSFVVNTTTIPHGYASDELIIQAFSNLGPSLVPSRTPDGRYSISAAVDATNIYFTLNASTAGAPTDPLTANITYKLIAI